MRRLLVTGAMLLSLLVARPPASVGAHEDGGSTTTTSNPRSSTSSTTSSSTSSTTTAAPDGSTSTTVEPEETTTTLPPEEDPLGHVDAPPGEVPVDDVTVPPAPGTPVDPGAAARVIRRELEVARAEVMESEEAVAELSEKVDELSSRLAGLQADMARLDAAQQRAVAHLDAARERFRDRIAGAVVRGNAAALDTIFTSGDATEVLIRKTYLATVSEADTAAVRDHRAAREVLEAGVAEAVDDVAATRRELRDARHRLREELALNARRRFDLAVFSAGSEIVIRGFVFPVGEPYEFVDSWGYPRMTGTDYAHGHKGSDIMAPFGTPLYAAERGVISRVGNDVLGGRKLWLKGESGTYYYYAHLQAYADDVAEGTVVDAGHVVGFVGDSGNAKGGPPHLHFQVHPGGGDAVNPYGLLRAVSDLTRR